MTKFNIAVLISGNGSNLQSLIDEFKSSQLVNISAYSLPTDYYKKRMVDISRINYDTIIDTSAKHITDTDLSIVIVGDIEKIEHGLESLGIPIIHSDSYGNKLK